MIFIEVHLTLKSAGRTFYTISSLLSLIIHHFSHQSSPVTRVNHFSTTLSAMTISRSWNYFLLMALTIGTAGYLYLQKSNNLKEYIGLMIFLWSYYYLTKAPPKEAVNRYCVIKHCMINIVVY